MEKEKESSQEPILEQSSVQSAQGPAQKPILQTAVTTKQSEADKQLPLETIQNPSDIKVVMKPEQTQPGDSSKDQSTQSSNLNPNPPVPAKPAFIGPMRPRSEEMTKLKIIGHGNFSSIHLVEEYKTGRKFAMKEYLRADAERKRKTQDLVMEKYVLNKLQACSRVVKLHETFKDDSSIYFNMEFLEGGELWDQCHVFGLPSKFEIKYYLYKIILALEEIHEKGIIHRDLKPENIMLTKDQTDLRLVDFATSWDFQNPEMKGSGNGSTGKRVYYHFVGTPQYMAYELVHNKGSYVGTDVYSLGCILYQLISGFPPFIGASEYLIFQQAEKGVVHFYPFFLDEEKELISKMMKQNHLERSTLADLKNSSYFKDHLDLYLNVAQSFQEIADHRTPQEKWLYELRVSIMAKIRDLDKDKPEDIEESPKQPAEGEEAKPANVPDEQPAVYKKQEKKDLIEKEVKEAESLIPEGERSKETMQQLLKHLRKQLKQKAKIERFEHYYEKQ